MSHHLSDFRKRSTLPLALGVLLERRLFRYILEGMLRLDEVDHLISDDFPTIYNVLAVLAALVVYWFLNYFRELLVLFRKLKSGGRLPEVVE